MCHCAWSYAQSSGLYDVWCVICDVWWMMCDVWCMMYDVLCTMYDDVWCMMMYDVWCMMYDVWCMMYAKVELFFPTKISKQIQCPSLSVCYRVTAPLWSFLSTSFFTQYIRRGMWCVKCVMCVSYIIHHTSYFIHHTLYSVHHTSDIIHHTSYYIIRHTSYIKHQTSYFIHHTSYTYLTHITCMMFRSVVCDFFTHSHWPLQYSLYHTTW